MALLSCPWTIRLDHINWILGVNDFGWKWKPKHLNRIVHNRSALKWCTLSGCRDSNLFVLWWYLFFGSCHSSTSAIETVCKRVFAVTFGTNENILKKKKFAQNECDHLYLIKSSRIFNVLSSGAGSKQMIKKNIRHKVEIKVVRFQKLK